MAFRRFSPTDPATLATLLNRLGDDLTQDISTAANSATWATITGKPTTFPAAAHQHTLADVTGLQSALAGKVDDDDSRLTDARTPTNHQHPVADVTGLQAALDGTVATTDARLTDARTPKQHGHVVGDIDGLVARLTALEYKSGVRNISTLLTNATGTVIIERTGPMITLSLDGITPTSALASGATFITLPSGFRPTRRYDVHLISTATTTNRSGFMFAAGGMGVWLPSTSERYRLVMTFPTNDPIPATLPGVPG